MNVLVIISSGLHLGYLGCYGNDWVATPALDKLAAEGVVFDQHYCDRVDSFGLENAACWTGRYSFPLPDFGQTPEIAPVLSLTALLQERGNFTKLVNGSKRPFGGSPEESIESALEHLASGHRSLVWLELPSLLPPWNIPQPFLDQYFQAQDEGEMSEPLTDPAIGSVDIEEAETLDRLRYTYAAAVTYVDSRIESILEGMRRQQSLDKTTILVTTDRGLALGEHGIIGDYRPWLHDELIHLPFIARLPDAAEAGRHVSTLTQPLDLMPTILDVLGVPIPNIHGHSLLLLLHGQATHIREYACSGARIGASVEWALRSPDWSFVLPVSQEPDDPPRGRQLYVKPEDRWDVNNVQQHNLELVESLERTLREFVAATQKPGLFQPPALIAPAPVIGVYSP